MAVFWTSVQYVVFRHIGTWGENKNHRTVTKKNVSRKPENKAPAAADQLPVSHSAAVSISMATLSKVAWQLSYPCQLSAMLFLQFQDCAD